MTEKNREFYVKWQAQLEEELAAVESDMAAAPRGLDRLRLEREAKKILDEIQKTEKELSKLDLNSSENNVKELSLNKYLQKIDFDDAKRTAQLIGNKLSQDGGPVLFFMQKSKRYMGRYCLDEVLKIILSDQVIEGRIDGAYKRYPVDLDSAISQYNEREFLIRLASHLEIEETDDMLILLKRIVSKIKASIDLGTTTLIEIKGVDELLEKEEFLVWFLEVFWLQVINELNAVFEKCKSKFIVVLVADSQVFDDALPQEYCCNGDAFDCGKMLELALPKWQVSDIQSWLIRFRNTLPTIQLKNNVEIARIARKIHRDSEGVPESICIGLKERFLKERLL